MKHLFWAMITLIINVVCAAILMFCIIGSIWDLMPIPKLNQIAETCLTILIPSLATMGVCFANYDTYKQSKSKLC